MISNSNTHEESFRKRREDDKTLAEIIRCLNEIKDKLDAHLLEHAKMTDHASPCEFLKTAFPGNDIEGHKKYHEEIIKAVADKAAFWRDIRKALTTWGLIGVLGWLAIIAWQAFVAGPPK